MYSNHYLNDLTFLKHIFSDYLSEIIFAIPKKLFSFWTLLKVFDVDNAHKFYFCNWPVGFELGRNQISWYNANVFGNTWVLNLNIYLHAMNSFFLISLDINLHNSRKQDVFLFPAECKETK